MKTSKSQISNSMLWISPKGGSRLAKYVVSTQQRLLEPSKAPKTYETYSGSAAI